MQDYKRKQQSMSTSLTIQRPKGKFMMTEAQKQYQKGKHIWAFDHGKFEVYFPTQI